MSDENSINGTKPPSKSLSKRTTPARPHRYRNSLIDSATRPPQWKRPNALKHGVFSATSTIPGEDPSEFIELHSALIEEWQPSGPSEQDAVLSLADLMWRKIRAQKFLQRQLLANTFDPGSPSFDQAQGLHNFILLLCAEPERAFAEYAHRWLLPEKIIYLKQKFPRSNYQSTLDWAKAVINEIETVLLPAAPSFKLPEPGDKFKEIRQFAADTQMAAAINDAMKFFDAELNLRERLDAMIERKIKHLFQLKAMKQMLRQTSIAREDEQPKRITAGKAPK